MQTSEYIEVIENMEVSKLDDYLNTLYKKELVAIGQELGYPTRMYQSKAQLVETVASSYKFIEVMRMKENRRNSFSDYFTI